MSSWMDYTDEQIAESPELQYARQQTYYKALFGSNDAQAFTADFLFSGGFLNDSVIPGKELEFAVLLQDRFRILKRAGITCISDVVRALGDISRLQGPPKPKPNPDHISLGK